MRHAACARRSGGRWRSPAVSPVIAGRTREGYALIVHGRARQEARPGLNRPAVVVDDGIATGASLRAALDVVRSAHLHRLVVAVPVAPPEACPELSRVADRVERRHQPEPFVAVGVWYGDFSQVSDDEVRTMLGTVPGRHPAG